MASKKELHPNIQGGQSCSVPSFSLSSARKIRRPPCPDWNSCSSSAAAEENMSYVFLQKELHPNHPGWPEPLRPFFSPPEQRPCRIRQGLARIGRRVGLEARCSVLMPSHILPSS